MKNKVKIILGVILLIAACIRLYRISDFMVFLGDEGRDALVVKGILEGNLTLLGPRASAGDFFTGPIYYYMMAPFLWIFRLDPVGPAIMVALFSVATVYLLFVVGKKFFNIKTGLIAAALYAVSPLVITYSRSSWNPNTVPFFSLLIMYLLYVAVTEKKNWKYYILIGFLLGISVQLHYISLFLGAAVALALIVLYWYQYKKRQVMKLMQRYLQIFLGFLLGFSPFLAFEVRHDFQNFKAIATFISGDTAQKGYATYEAFYQPVADVFFRLFARLIFNFPVPAAYKQFPQIDLQIYGTAIVLIALASMIVLLMHKKKAVVGLLLIWMILGTVLFGFYKKPIYDYYLVFMFPLPFLIISNFITVVATLKKKKLPYGLLISVVFFMAVLAYNIYGLPIHAPNGQKEQAKRIASFVISKADNKPFNFGLITPGNSDHAYRYYFEVLGHAPITIEPEAVDPQRKTVTDQLMIICEDISCNPQGHPLYEVAGFGAADIGGKWDVSVVKVYKLIHQKKQANEASQ